MAFGQHAERRELPQSASSGRDERVEARVTFETRPQGLERLQLKCIHRVAIDHPITVELMRSSLCGAHRRVGRVEAGYVLDAQVERVAETPAARKVRARLLMHDRR